MRRCGRCSLAGMTGHEKAIAFKGLGTALEYYLSIINLLVPTQEITMTGFEPLIAAAAGSLAGIVTDIRKEGGKLFGIFGESLNEKTRQTIFNASRSGCKNSRRNPVSGLLATALKVENGR